MIDPRLSPEQLKSIALKVPGILDNPGSLKTEGTKLASEILGIDLSNTANIGRYSSLSGLTKQVAGVALKSSKLRRQLPANLQKIADLAGDLLDDLI